MNRAVRVQLSTLSIARFDGIVGRFPAVLSRCFTASERSYCDSRKRKPAQHFAARMAAKLACRYLLGAGRLIDIEVSRDDMGAPHLVFHGTAAEAARGQCVRVSLSHDEDMAAAIVALEPV